MKGQDVHIEIGYQTWILRQFPEKNAKKVFEFWISTIESTVERYLRHFKASDGSIRDIYGNGWIFQKENVELPASWEDRPESLKGIEGLSATEFDQAQKFLYSMVEFTLPYNQECNLARSLSQCTSDHSCTFTGLYTALYAVFYGDREAVALAAWKTLNHLRCDTIADVPDFIINFLDCVKKINVVDDTISRRTQKSHLMASIGKSVIDYDVWNLLPVLQSTDIPSILRYLQEKHLNHERQSQINAMMSQAEQCHRCGKSHSGNCLRRPRYGQ